VGGEARGRGGQRSTSTGQHEVLLNHGGRQPRAERQRVVCNGESGRVGGEMG
jgi:hypothetical protein